jgi:O-antigen/teichoic acid export membrane protein
VLAGLIALFIGVVSPSIFVWFYPDRYQQALPAIPFLAGAGFMHLLSVIPRSYLVGRGSTSFINRMVLTEGTGLVLALSVGLIGAYFIGTQGLAVGLVFVEAVRLIISILYWRSLRSLELKSR